MNWLVAIQPQCERPPEIAEVRTLVVSAETEAGVRAQIAEEKKGQMIRWLCPENPTAWGRAS